MKSERKQRSHTVLKGATQRLSRVRHALMALGWKIVDLPGRRAAHQHNAAAKIRPNFTIKLMIWCYFGLLIGEGALRKWVVPGLATPLLVARDPLAVIALALGFANIPSFQKNLWVWLFAGAGLISFLATLLVGHGNPSVGLFGLRIFVLHIPLIFLIGEVFERRDVERMMVTLLLIAIPMSVLILAQYFLPQGHWVNRAVGGEEAIGFAGAMGRTRPPGVFSFTNGNVAFFSMVIACQFAFIAAKKPRIWWIAPAFAIAIALVFSISRQLWFQGVLTLLATIFVLIWSGRGIRRLLQVSLACVCLMVPLSFHPAVKEGMLVMSTRMESANQIEGGLVEGVIVNRLLGGLVKALETAPNEPLMGRGLGMGSNVGAKFLAGERGFLLAEGDWGRTVGEMGPVLGLIIIFLRVALTAGIGIAALKNTFRGDGLALVLGSGTLLGVLMGQMAQPTSMGFVVLGGGLTLAALKAPRAPETAEIQAPAEPQSKPSSTIRQGSRPAAYRWQSERPEHLSRKGRSRRRSRRLGSSDEP